MPEDNGITISYETLFEILRREKSKESLQKLDLDFFDKVVTYLIGKSKQMEQAATGPLEKNGVQEQVFNTRRILKDLYDRRESKIINLALSRSRTGSTLIDTSTMLPEEQEFYNRLTKVFNNYRSEVLSNVLDVKRPTLNISKKISDETAASLKKDDVDTSIDEDDTDEEVSDNESNETEDGAIAEENPEDIESSRSKKVRILAEIPKFVGRDLNSYGPFSKQDEAVLPVDLAELLISKGRAEEL